ncbi:MAG: formylglycine-generating enzyme family protein, partial [Planctomycetota bacterium]
MLPTQAQWEYGCRGTTSSPYWFEFADMKDFANVAGATAKRAGVPWTCEAWSDGHIVHAPVGTFGANRFGLHHVHDNVWEWCLNGAPPAASPAAAASTSLPSSRGRTTATRSSPRTAATTWACVPPGQYGFATDHDFAKSTDQLRPCAAGRSGVAGPWTARRGIVEILTVVAAEGVRHHAPCQCA